jgi:hypothetical protein
VGLKQVRGVETISEIEITCDHCGKAEVTVRDIVPRGWVETRLMSGMYIHRVPFSKKREDNPSSLWFCRAECVVLFYAGVAAAASRLPTKEADAG